MGLIGVVLTASESDVLLAPYDVIMPQKPTETLTYFDTVRGFSSQLVVMGHAAVLCFGSLQVTLPNGKLGANPSHFHIQSYSVVAFLVLSGFLITYSSRRKLDKGTFSMTTFTVDRATRILTPLLPLIPIVWLADRFLIPGQTSDFVVLRYDLHTVVWNLLLLQDNAWFTLADQVFGSELGARSLGSAAPWWTVAYEWWIYMLFGSITALAVSKKSKKLMLVLAPVVLFAAGSVLGRLLAGNGLVIAWSVGALAAANHVRLSHWGKTKPALVFTAAALTSAILIAGGIDVYNPLLCAVTGVALVALFYALPTMKSTRWVGRLNQFVADYSYSLYLVHFSVMIWIVGRFPQFTGIWAWLVLVAAGNAAAIVWWLATERNHRAVNRFIKGRLGRKKPEFQRLGQPQSQSTQMDSIALSSLPEETSESVKGVDIRGRVSPRCNDPK